MQRKPSIAGARESGLYEHYYRTLEKVQHSVLQLHTLLILDRSLHLKELDLLL